MNLKHLYEKHIAEKLVQLPPPGDPDQNWQQMKTLLDKNMPRGGGSGAGGSYRWWIAGTVIIAVLVGTWFGGRQLLTTEKRNEAVAGKIKTVNNKTAPAVALTDKKSEQPAMPSAGEKNEGARPVTTLADPKGASYASVTEPQDNSNGTVDAAALQNETVVKNSSDAKNNAEANNQPAANQPAAAGYQSVPSNNDLTEKAEHARSSGNNNESNPPLLTATGNSKNPVVPVKTTNRNNKTNTDRKNIYADNKKYSNKKRVSDFKINSNKAPDNISGIDVANNDATLTNKATAKKGKANKPVKKTAPAANKQGKDAEENNRFVYLPSIAMPNQHTSGAGLLKESPVVIMVDYTGAAVVAPSGVLQRDFTYYTQAELFPDMVVNSKGSRRKSSRSSHASEDRRFALGLSLPLAFPVGDQHALGYNRQAGVNTVSDYIPSPHFQYHFNNKTYLQTGLQFASPQFIRSFLLYENTQSVPGPNAYDLITSISARKLYYFNVPVSVYHSPLRNFYMGAGLQFSSLLSGVAYYEEIKRKYSPMGPPQDYLIKNSFIKFQNDDLSRRLNSNEVRLLVDMNYYFNRFTVGLQYNQAFNNYVSFQVTPNSPYTFDKNKSLQFYLRYNIWEDKKRKQPRAGSMLTLK